MKRVRSGAPALAIAIALGAPGVLRSQAEAGPRLELLAGGGCLDRVRVTDSVWTGDNPLAFDAQGMLYAANDSGTCIYRLDPATAEMTRFAGTGSQAFRVGAGRLESAMDRISRLVWDPAGHLIVVEAGAHRVLRIDGRSGVVTLVAGTGQQGAGGDGGQAQSAQLNVPRDVAFDKAGHLYIADTGNCRVRKVDAQASRISTVYGNAGCGAGAVAPASLAFGRDGLLYGADANGTRQPVVEIGDGGAKSAGYPTTDNLWVLRGAGDGGIYGPTWGRIWRFFEGKWSVIAGAEPVGESVYSPDGTPAIQAQIRPIRMALDPRGTIYFIDLTSRGYLLRKIDAAGRLATLAGEGNRKFFGEGRPAREAHLGDAAGVAYDREGTLYIADRRGHKVVRVDPRSGILTTLAGTGVPGYNGENVPAALAQVTAPHGIAVAPDGSVYFTEAGGQRLRRVAQGIVSTVAGSGEAGSSGDGGSPAAAKLNEPRGVAVDLEGAIYVAEVYGHRIRKIANGAITTVAGTGTAGSAGLGGAALQAQLNGPLALAMTPEGDLLIGEWTEGGRLLRLSKGQLSQVESYPSIQAVAVDPYGTIYYAADYRPAGALPFQMSCTVSRVADGRHERIVGPRWGCDRTLLDPLPEPSVYRAFLIRGIAWDPLTGTLALADSIGSTYNDSGRVVRYAAADHLRPLSSVSEASGTAGGVVSLRFRAYRGSGMPAAGVRVTASVSDGRAALRDAAPVTNADGAGKVTVTLPDDPGQFEVNVSAPGFQSGWFTVRGRALPGAYGGVLEAPAGMVQALGASRVRPDRLAIDRAGNWLVADAAASRVYRVDVNTHAVKLVAGTGEKGNTGDGSQAIDARLDFNDYNPGGIAVDAAGNVFLLQPGSIRKIDASTGRISTLPVSDSEFLGSGFGGASLAIDSKGALYDGCDYFYQRMYRTDPATGVRQLLTNLTTGWCRGPFAIGPRDEVYYIRGWDVYRHELAGGSVSLVAGGAAIDLGPYDPAAFDGGNAVGSTLWGTAALAYDPRGGLWVATRSPFSNNPGPDNRLFRVDLASGMLQLYAGNGAAGTAVPGSLSHNSPLPTLVGMRFDPAGNLQLLAGQYSLTVGGFPRVTAVGQLILPPKDAPLLAASPLANAASFTREASIAPDTWMSLFGIQLAPRLRVADLDPLPESLEGTSLRIVDSGGKEHTPRLHFVAPGQINFLAPAEMAPGPGKLSVRRQAGESKAMAIVVERLLPGMFTARATGEGVAAAFVLRVRADGTQLMEPVFGWDPELDQIVFRPILVPSEGERVYVQLYGTGWRSNSGPGSVRVTIGGFPIPVLFAGAQGSYAGLDQLNIGPLPVTLKEKPGEVEVVVEVEGKRANIVRIGVY